MTTLQGYDVIIPSGRRINLLMPDDWVDDICSGFIVHLHGGGWAGGSHLALPEYWSEALADGCAVASVEYPLAPVLQGRALLDDVASSIRWLLDCAEDELVVDGGETPLSAIDRSSWILAGESVGGYLALKTAEEIQARGVIAVSPPVDLRGMGAQCYPMGAGFDWGAPDSGLSKFLGFSIYDTHTPEQLQILTDLVVSVPDCPLWIANHAGDAFVPSTEGRRLANAAASRFGPPRRVVAEWLTGAAHGARVMQDSRLLRSMLEFIQEVAS